MTTITKVLLVNDHPLTLKRFASKLNEDGKIEAVVVRGNDASLIELIKENQADIVVYVFADDEQGFLLVKEIERMFKSQVRVIALTKCVSAAVHGAFFRHGGWGYILKSAHEDEIMLAVRNITRGKRYLCPDLGAQQSDKLHSYASPPGKKVMDSLSQKEIFMLPNLAAGETLNEIAGKHNISTQTAKLHRQSVMNKLGVHNQTELRMKLLYLALD